MGKVLVIEDEEHVRRMIEVIIKKQGHEVKLAASGEEALAMINAGRKSGDLPELVLLDIMLSGIDGLQILRALSAREETRNISTIMITSLTQATVVAQGIKLGAKGYLKKPFHPKELMDRVVKFLG